jgi:cytochrome c biogenesis protein
MAQGDRRRGLKAESRSRTPSLLRLLNSMGFAIVLLLVLVVVSALGVILPQRAPHDVYMQKYGLFLGRIVVALGFNDVFRVWWYVALWAVVVGCLLTCSITRLPKHIRAAFGKTLISDPNELSAFALCARLSVRSSAEDGIREARALFKRKGFKWHEGDVASGGEPRAALAHRGGLERLGPFVTHISVVIVLFGGFLSSIVSTNHHQPAYGGQIFEVPDFSYKKSLGYHASRIFRHLSEEALAREEMEGMDWRALPDIPERDVAFKVRVDDFRIETTPEGRITDYKTTATVLDPDSLFNFVIEVNKPLVYKGYYFYQSSYGYSSRSIKSVRLGVTAAGGQGTEEVDLPFREPALIPGTDVTVVVTDFVSDFVYDIETKTAASRSEEHRNPAVKIEVYRDGVKQFDQWLLMRSMGAHASKDREYSFEMLGYDPDLYTVLEVRTHPVMGVIWTGCGVMVVGVFLSFYVTQRRVWIAARPEPGGGAEMFLAAATRKDKESFRRDFYGIVRTLKEVLHADRSRRGEGGADNTASGRKLPDREGADITAGTEERRLDG